MLVRSSVANLKFGLSFTDGPTQTKALGKLVSLGAANTWTTVTLPSLPTWPAGNWSLNPGNQGYSLNIELAAGSGITLAANDTWQSTATLWSPVGISNFMATLNATIDIALVQHEPGSVCSTFMDKPWCQNYDECQRYFQKSYGYPITPGTSDWPGAVSLFCCSTSTANGGINWRKYLAKTPTVIQYYAPNTGTVGTAYDNTSGAAITVSNGPYYDDSGSFQITGAFTVGHTVAVQYTADTGW
jgi:hypothetical protein